MGGGGKARGGDSAFGEAKGVDDRVDKSSATPWCVVCVETGVAAVAGNPWSRRPVFHRHERWREDKSEHVGDRRMSGPVLPSSNVKRHHHPPAASPSGAGHFLRVAGDSLHAAVHHGPLTTAHRPARPRGEPAHGEPQGDGAHDLPRCSACSLLLACGRRRRVPKSGERGRTGERVAASGKQSASPMRAACSLAPIRSLLTKAASECSVCTAGDLLTRRTSAFWEWESDLSSAERASASSASACALARLAAFAEAMASRGAFWTSHASRGESSATSELAAALA